MDHERQRMADELDRHMTRLRGPGGGDPADVDGCAVTCICGWDDGFRSFREQSHGPHDAANAYRLHVIDALIAAGRRYTVEEVAEVLALVAPDQRTAGC